MSFEIPGHHTDEVTQVDISRSLSVLDGSSQVHHLVVHQGLQFDCRTVGAHYAAICPLTDHEGLIVERNLCFSDQPNLVYFIRVPVIEFLDWAI